MYIIPRMGPDDGSPEQNLVLVPFRKSAAQSYLLVVSRNETVESDRQQGPRPQSVDTEPT